MYRGKNHRSRRAVLQHLIEKRVGNLRRVLGIGELRLLGVGVAVQPVEQLFTVGCDDVELGIVHVTIDETGENQLAAEVLDTGSIRNVPGLADSGDLPVVNEQRAVLDVLVSRIIEAVKDRAEKCLHRPSPSTSMTVSPSVCSSQLGASVARSTTRKLWPSSNAISGMCQVPR